MKGHIEIRKATTNDIPQLVQLINSAYRGETSREGWTTEADFLEGIRTDENALARLINASGCTMLIGMGEADKIIGCVYLQNKGGSMYLGMLTVWPKLQAKGIGRQLLDVAENFAKEQGCNLIEMTVISIRHELIAWYNKQGYHSTGITKPFPTDNKFGTPNRPLEFMVLTKTL